MIIINDYFWVNNSFKTLCTNGVVNFKNVFLNTGIDLNDNNVIIQLICIFSLSCKMSLGHLYLRLFLPYNKE